MTHAQALEDRRHLWLTYGAPHELDVLTDQHWYFEQLLSSPTKRKAADILTSQIVFWMTAGPGSDEGKPDHWMDDPQVRRIAEDYQALDEFDALRARWRNSYR